MPVVLAAGESLLSLLPLVLLLGLGYVMLVLPQRQKERRYQDMVSGLKEKDHVLTSSGIYGVVTSVQRDQQRVTIRVDEASGAKIRIAMWGILEVITDDSSSGSSASSKDSTKK